MYKLNTFEKTLDSWKNLKITLLSKYLVFGPKKAIMFSDLRKTKPSKIILSLRKETFGGTLKSQRL